MTTKTQLETAMTSIRAIDSAQYGYTKYKGRIESCFLKITEDDLTKLAEYGLFMLSTQDETAQDALIAAFRQGFLSPKQQKATGTKPVAVVPVAAATPTTSRAFLARRLDSATASFILKNETRLCSGLGPHILAWNWRELMLDSDFVGDYEAIAEYEQRFARFIASLPYQPTAWKPVSDSHIELSIGLAEFSAIQPMPSAARFEDGKMLWVVAVPVQVPEPVQVEPVQEPAKTKPVAAS